MAVKGGVMEKKGFPNIQAVTTHHTRRHCPIREQKIFHCPYCLAVSGKFCSIKAHIMLGTCRFVRNEEIDKNTWTDLMIANADMNEELNT